MIAFMWGTWMPLGATLVPASVGIASNMAGYVPSWSRIRYVALQPASWRSIARLRVAWPTRAAVGWVVAPRTRMRRLACSITVGMCIRAAVSVTVSVKSAAGSAWAWECGTFVQVVAARSGAGSIRAWRRISPTVGGASV